MFNIIIIYIILKYKKINIILNNFTYAIRNTYRNKKQIKILSFNT